VLGRVAGRVRLWGTVVECERGWRASHAYPSRLLVALDDGRSRLDAGSLALEPDEGVVLRLL
jgi:hypothetical protein